MKKQVIITAQAEEFIASMASGSFKRNWTMKKPMTKKEREIWAKERIVITEALTRKAEAMPGYAEVLAETIAENDAAEIIQTIARKSKLTQKEIAKRMNVSQPRISQIANGEDLSLSTLYRYAAACGAKLQITAIF